LRKINQHTFLVIHKKKKVNTKFLGMFRPYKEKNVSKNRLRQSTFLLLTIFKPKKKTTPIVFLMDSN
jgi:hypothetical protein